MVVDLRGCDYDSRRIWSLLELLQLYADLFIQNLWEIYKIEGQWVHGRIDGVIPFPIAVGAKAHMLQLDCEVYGFTSTAMKCARVSERCTNGQPLTYREGVALMKELRERLEDDLHSRIFLSLTSQEGAIYSKPTEGWSEIISRFREARDDIEEMRKCFALGRYPASVFHAMQTVEHGLIHLGNWLRIDDPKPGWVATTRELGRVVNSGYNKATDWQQASWKFIEQMQATTQILMTAWRHKIDHAAGRLAVLPGEFAPETANDIISASRAFMFRLATELPR